MAIDRTVAPQIHSVTSFAIPQPQVTTLPNGVVVKLFNRSGLDVCRLNVVWDDGANSPEAMLRSTLMNGTIAEGTSQMCASEVADFIEYNGAWLNAASDDHSSNLTIHVLGHRLKNVLPVVSDIITDPIFDENAFAAVRDKAIAQAEVKRARVMSHAGALDSAMMFGFDSVRAFLPTADDYMAVSREDIISLHQRIYTGMTPTVYVTGDLSDSTFAQICDMIGTIKFGDTKPTAIKPLSPADGERKAIVHLPDTLQSAIIMSIPTVPRAHEDFIPLRLTVMALGGYFGSRLMSNIREEKGYTYGITAAMLGFREGSYIQVSTQAACEYTDAVITEIGNELERMKTCPPEGEELAILKQHAMTSLLTQFDNPYAVTDHFITRQTLHIPDDYISRQVEVINALDSALLAQMATQYFDADRLYISIATK